jgi:hypothetical protein
MTIDYAVSNPTAVPILCVGQVISTVTGESMWVEGVDTANTTQPHSLVSYINVKRNARDFTDDSPCIELKNIFSSKYAIKTQLGTRGLQITANFGASAYNTFYLQRLQDHREFIFWNIPQF